MKKSFFPIFTTPTIISNKKTVFHKINEKVEVEVPGKLIRQLIEICDGTRPLNEVTQLLKDEWDELSVQGLIEELHQNNVLTNSCNISSSVWKTVENPSRFSSLITDDEVIKLVRKAKERHKGNFNGRTYQISTSPLKRLLENRRSVRSFSKKPVNLQNVVNMLWSAYGEISDTREGAPTSCRHTIPSAGALYPLVIHVVLFKGTGEIGPGIYKAWMGLPGTVGFKLVSKDTDRFIRSFVNPLMFNEAHGTIVISGSFDITSKKYGNRSMLYVTLEAGHATQNVHLVASESKVATVEIGGFIEDLLAETIKLSKDYRPLTTVIFGNESRSSHVDSKQEVELSWVIPTTDSYRLPFTMALAKVSDDTNRNWSGGKSLTPQLAQTKAIAEAKEWAACGCIPNTLVHARHTDLDMVIDPSKIIDYHPAQYRVKGFPFKPYNKELEYSWVSGKNELAGSNKYILADHIYFPYNTQAPPYTHANSSGVAAHPDRQKAVELSTLELIERDAFMIAYLTKLIFPTVSQKTLPQKIQKRIKELKKVGFSVWIKDFSLDLAPVIFIFAQNQSVSYTTCATSSGFDAEEAVDHALMEVECAVWSRLSGDSSGKIIPSKVWFAKDHAEIYRQHRYFRKADFMILGQEKIKFHNVGKNVAHSWQELLNKFATKEWQLFTVPLFLSEELGGNDELHIVRSIVPGIVPMTFGYRQEPIGLERIYTIAKEFGKRTVSYRDLQNFPHPFA